MRIGIACPYSWEVPGGVQFHIRDLAECLLAMGHDVSVLAPADEDSGLPPYLVAAGRAVPVPYNGSVARLAFGPLSAARVRRWLSEGGFDVVHVHEPTTPSLSMLACWAATSPVVGTFHTSNVRSRAMTAAHPVLFPTLEKISARIAVSEEARRTLVDHLGGNAVVIPNGVFVDRFRGGTTRPEWQGSRGTVGFLGRLDEPRKGLPVFLEAVERILPSRPGLRVVIAGRGDIDDVLQGVSPALREAVLFLGEIDEAAKASLLRTLDLYVAPNLGGESFGIILAEAMAAGAPVLASDLEAFRAVLDDGRAGALFAVGDATALATSMASLLDDPSERARLAEAGRRHVRRYDWSRVAAEILSVYETVAAGAPVTREDARPGLFARWRS